MHPWSTPPLNEEESRKNEYPCNLPYERQFEKIKTVTSALTKAFGKPPTSFRSGRFGFNTNTLKAIQQLGYLVDTSITPMVSWKKDNGPSFLDYRANPFWLNHSKSRILEVPVTIGLNRKVPGFIEKMYLRIPKFARVRGLLSKDYLNLIDLVWLYPALFSERDMISVVDVMLKKSINVFNIFFHKSLRHFVQARKNKY